MDPRDSTRSAREQLGERLRVLQVRSGKSLKQLEMTVHASDSSLSRYLAGTTVPPWPVVESLCREAGEEAEEVKGLWERAGRGARAARTRRPIRRATGDLPGRGGVPAGPWAWPSS
jgi:transcriptional regulator with XRE-family HTH domain